MKHRNIKVQTLISSTFAFLLTLLLFTLAVCTGLGIGVFNSKSVISKINETDYYSKIYTELNKRAEEIVSQAGLPDTVLQDVITLERVYAGSSNYINSTLEGKKPQVYTDKLQAELTEHINQYLNDQGIEQTDATASSMDKVVARIKQEYISDVKLKFINYFSDYKSHFWDLMKFMMPLNIALIGILCFFLLKMHHYKHRGLRYINYAMLSSSMLITIISGGMLMNKDYQKLNVMPYYYRDFLTAYLQWDIRVFLYIGGLGFILSIMLISLTGYLKKKATNS